MESKPVKLERVIAAAGGPSAVAGVFGISPWAVSRWVENDKVPAERVIGLCRATDFLVTPHQVRPDIYPDPHWLPPDAKPNDERVSGVCP